MKNLLLILLTCLALALPAAATPVATTITTVTNPQTGSVSVLVSPAQPSAPYYHLVYRTVTRSGTTTNELVMPMFYSGASTHTPENIYCATTYAEMAAEATTLGITIPAQVSGQP